MRILVDINHPAHVHLFRNVAKRVMNDGHDVHFTTRRKEIAHILLEKYDLPFTVLGPHYKSMRGKLWGIVKYDLLLLRVATKFQPDVCLSMGSIYMSHVAYLLNKPHLLLQDTENAKLQNKLSLPFASLILTPDCYKLDLGKKHFRYPGYHETAYLNPTDFKPDISVLTDLGIPFDEPFCIIRWVSRNANHDVGHNGMSESNKGYAVKQFRKYARVYITSETELPEELESHRIKISPERIHHALYYAKLLFGESATMASEAAMLGTPSIFIDNDGRGYTDELESIYSLVHNFSESTDDQERAIQKGGEILSDPKYSASFMDNYQRMRRERINLTDLLYSVLLNFDRNGILAIRKEDVNSHFMESSSSI